MPDTLTITDNRTGAVYEVPVEEGAIRATALRQIKLDEDDFGLMSYDPAFMNTASVRSAVTFIDGDQGILRYRGYPIEQLAVESTYLETAYLLLFGELPTAGRALPLRARGHLPHVPAREHEDAHAGLPLRRAPDGDVRQRRRGALGTLYPEACEGRRPGRPPAAGRPPDREGADDRRLVVPAQQGPAVRLPGQRPRLRRELPLDDVQDGRAALPAPTRRSTRALEVLFILHADHEQNCSANAMRAIGSSKVDPYSAMAGAAAALYGPLHGGANEAVLRMLAADRRRRRTSPTSSRASRPARAG